MSKTAPRVRKAKTMRYLEAPNRELYDSSYKIFLAGGITGCPDWQAVLVKRLQDLPDNITILNPRRASWPIDDPTASEAQITWEFDMLQLADLIVFWFPPQTLCPIVLYELGRWNAKSTPKIVGIHPKYARKLDVEIQTRLADKLWSKKRKTPIVYSLSAIEFEIRATLKP